MQPNILTILPDDCGKEQFRLFGVGTSPAPTPNIARLAQSGVIFTRAYSQPWCSPTRAEMMTGSYGFRTGIGSLAEYNNQPLLNNEVCLPAALKTATGGAYACAEIGKHHLSSFQTGGHGELAHPIDMGFDYFTGTLRNLENGDDYYNWLCTTAERTARGVQTAQARITQYAPSYQVDAALRWIARQTGPWWLHQTINLPHQPFDRPPSDLYDTTLYSLPSQAPPDGSVAATSRPYYKAMIQAMDHEIGRLLSSMPQETLANTVVVLWCDNGTPANVVDADQNGLHAKRTVFELGCNVPLIVAGPGISGAGRTTSAIVKSVDLFRTVIELAGGDYSLVPTPAAHIRDSASFLPVLQASASTARTFAWLDLFGPNAPHINCSVNGSRAIAYSRYKLIKSATTGVTFPSSSGGATNANDAFYDLQTDPNETFNLIGAGSPFVAGSVITLTDVNPTYLGAKSAYDAAVSQYASLTASL